MAQGYTEQSRELRKKWRKLHTHGCTPTAHITTMGFRSVGRGAIQQVPEMTQVLTEWPGRFIPHLGSLSSGN